jgi:hypothetical protein
MMSSEMGRDRAWNYGIPARKAGQNSVRRIEIEEIHGELDFLLQNGYKENNADTQTRRYYTNSSIQATGYYREDGGGDTNAMRDTRRVDRIQSQAAEPH